MKQSPERLLFATLVVLHLIPLWIFKYFPSQDGPAHVHIANVLLEYYRPEYTVFREYYAINTALAPNWFVHFALAGLMRFAPALTAEKILLSVYVILLPVSARYALRAIRADAGFLAVLVFPFIYNYLFHMGFYNFSYSLPLFFFLIGCWMKYQDRFTSKYALALIFISLLTYFCHLISVAMACTAIAMLTIWLMSWDVAQQMQLKRPLRPRVLWSILWARAIVPLLAFVPTLAFAAMFLFQNPTYSAAPPAGKLFQGLHNLYALVSYDQREAGFATVLADSFLGLLVYFLVSKAAHRQVSRWDGFLFVTVAYICIYFTAPDEMAGGGFVNDRLSLYPFMALMLWFGAQACHRMIKLNIQLIAVGVALGLLGLHGVKYAELQSYLQEYLSGASFIKPNTTLLSLSFSGQGYAPDGRALSQRVEPFTHLDGYIAVQRHIVPLSDYHAATNYFPIAFRPSLDPFAHIGIENGLGFQPPRVDFITYPQRTSGRVDYVLVWQVRAEQWNDPNTQSIFRQLEKGYELIYTSSPRGYVQLYRRKEY